MLFLEAKLSCMNAGQRNRNRHGEQIVDRQATQYVAAYDTYEATLISFADTDTKKAYTLCALASIAYTYERVDDAKTLLFQSIQIKTPVITGLLASASLGILHNDEDLTALVLNVLKLYENHCEYGHHVVNLFAYSHIIGNNAKSAITNLSKSIHMYPDDVRYWVPLLRILQKTDLQTFSKCAQKVLRLNKDIATGHHPHVACALSINCFTQILIPKHIRSVQKLLFTYPGHVESWAMFIATFLSRIAETGFETPKTDRTTRTEYHNHKTHKTNLT
ncbi:Tetratricopeptide repeat protein 37 [Eufriesea mexicana]|nr:Tetratricopeptide repeat protein 37 [Eufriesea mexicana]